MTNLRSLSNQELLEHLSELEQNAGQQNNEVGFLDRDLRTELDAARSEVLRRMSATG